MKRIAFVALIAAAMISFAVNVALGFLIYDVNQNLRTLHGDAAIALSTQKQLISALGLTPLRLDQLTYECPAR